MASSYDIIHMPESRFLYSDHPRSRKEFFGNLKTAPFLSCILSKMGECPQDKGAWKIRANIPTHQNLPNFKIFLLLAIDRTPSSGSLIFRMPDGYGWCEPFWITLKNASTTVGSKCLDFGCIRFLSTRLGDKVCWSIAHPKHRQRQIFVQLMEFPYLSIKVDSRCRPISHGGRREYHRLARKVRYGWKKLEAYIGCWRMTAIRFLLMVGF